MQRATSMNVAFTGTREGMSERQKRALSVLLRSLDIQQLDHGACIGADEECVVIYKQVGLSNATIYARPSYVPDTVSQKAMDLSHVRFPVSDPLERNRLMVIAANLLIAAPLTMQEQQRGGTWYTIRFARKMGRPVIILDR